jgi:hypothetical protein
MAEEQQATEYPITTTHLRKGSIVSVEVLEEAFGVKRGTDAFQLAALRAADYITKRLAQRGEMVTVAQRKCNLVILTDTEASSYNEQRFDTEIGSAARALRRMAAVDRSQVDATRLAAHDRALEVRGRMLAAARRERRQASLAPHKRETPALPRRAK